VRADAVKHGQTRRERVDQDEVAPHMAIATSLPLSGKWMITMPRFQGNTRGYLLHRDAQIRLKVSSRNPLPEITTKLTF
jgi:hypothetical protein